MGGILRVSGRSYCRCRRHINPADRITIVQFGSDTHAQGDGRNWTSLIKAVTTALTEPSGKAPRRSSEEQGPLHPEDVRPFPNVNDRKWTISTVGGQHALWSRNGRELFYVVGSAVMKVPVDTRGSEFVAGRPELLFSGPFDTSYTRYALSPDDSHFIMVEVDPGARPTQVHVILNWAEELKPLTAASRR